MGPTDSLNRLWRRNFWHQPGIEAQALQRSSGSLVTILHELSQFPDLHGIAQNCTQYFSL
jgi:hypothetical protein